MSSATKEFNSIFNNSGSISSVEASSSGEVAAESIRALQAQASDFISALDWALWGGVLAAAAGLFLVFRIVSANKYAVALGFKKIRYSLPLFSPLYTYSRDLGRYKGRKFTVPHGLYMLFADFSTFYRTFNKGKEDYDNWRAYLRKVGELDRKPMPWYVGITILGLVLFEAILIAYVIQNYVMPGGTKADYDFWAVVVGVIIAIVMMILTHKSGTEMHYNAMVDKLRGIMVSGEKLEKNPLVDWENNKDDGQSAAQQMFNRLNPYTDSMGVPKKRYLIITMTASLILGMTVAAYVVRATTFLDELGSTSHESSIAEMFNRDGIVEKGKGTVSFDELIQEDRADVIKSSKSARNDAMNIMKEKNLILANETTFMVLSGMFFAIQFLSIIFGRTYGFIGSESERVYHALRGFDNQERFVHYMEIKRREVQSSVRILQRKWYKKAEAKAFGEEVELLKESASVDFLEFVQNEIEASTNKTNGGSQ